uniref:Reverse transcriptase/retrotransposon-derived protein RNase H-like domain-containing protein n=1 Tax=Neogobius melanostomus TaxID=47308 RepID=A0A8C6WKT6_9GOBI
MCFPSTYTTSYRIPFNYNPQKLYALSTHRQKADDTKIKAIWQPHHSEALQTLKTALTQAPVLRFYDQKKPLPLQADSSKDGLGACLLQEGRPVCYASRALTDTEKRYAQIEKRVACHCVCYQKIPPIQHMVGLQKGKVWTKHSTAIGQWDTISAFKRTLLWSETIS